MLGGVSRSPSKVHRWPLEWDPHPDVWEEVGSWITMFSTLTPFLSLKGVGAAAKAASGLDPAPYTPVLVVECRAEPGGSAGSAHLHSGRNAAR